MLETVLSLMKSSIPQAERSGLDYPSALAVSLSVLSDVLCCLVSMCSSAIFPVDRYESRSSFEVVCRMSERR